MANIERSGSLLTSLQQLPTSGARAVEVFTNDEGTFLGVPQLARDVAGEAPYMNGGDSDIDALIYRCRAARISPTSKSPAGSFSRQPAFAREKVLTSSIATPLCTNGSKENGKRCSAFRFLQRSNGLRFLSPTGISSPWLKAW
jgi:hypothetical protein